MASEHALLARLEEHFESALVHHDFYRQRLETVMQFLPELATKIKDLTASHQVEIAGRMKAEAELADLQKQTAADEATAKTALDAVTAELTAEKPDPAASASTGSAPTAPVVTTAGSATVIVVPAASSAPGIDPATGTSVAPGTTAHSDTSTGVTTTVPHDGSAPTAVAASGAAVQPEPAVVQAATAATAAAGVTMPVA